MRSLRIICPNGHLGFAPTREESFRLGVAARPDCIAADSGSDDVGPIPLGTDTSTSPLGWQTHDLELMLRRVARARRADDHRVGGRHGRQQPRRPVRARSSASWPRSIGSRRSGSAISIPRSGREDLRRRMRARRNGRRARRLRSADRSASSTRRSGSSRWRACIRSFDLLREGRRRDHRRAQQRQLRVRRTRDPSRLPREPGVLPRQGARVRVVLRGAVRRQGDGAGRSDRGRRRGHRDASGAALHGGVGGGHAMYERTNPYYEHVAGGTLDMSECRYEQIAEKTTRITGAKFVPAGGISRQARRRRQSRRALRRHGRHPRSVHDRARRHGDRLGASAGARALRRVRATNSTTPSTAATA